MQSTAWQRGSLGSLGGDGLVTGDSAGSDQTGFGPVCVLAEGVEVPVQTGDLEPGGYHQGRPQLQGPWGSMCSGTPRVEAAPSGPQRRPTVQHPTEEPLPPTVFLQHPLLRKLNIVLTAKERCLKEL